MIYIVYNIIISINILTLQYYIYHTTKKKLLRCIGNIQKILMVKDGIIELIYVMGSK